MDIAAFLIYCLVVTATPGPANIAILSISTNTGIRAAFRYIFGAACALLLALTLSSLFSSALSSVAEIIVLLMRYIGCAYMLYLAWQVLRMQVSDRLPRQTASFLSGFTMQLVNPKVWLLALTLIPSFVTPYYLQTSAALGFSLITVTIGTLTMTVWAFFGMMLIRFLHKYRKLVNIGLALLLVYSAIEVSGIFTG